MQETRTRNFNELDSTLLKQSIAQELYRFKDLNEIKTYNKVLDVVIVGNDIKTTPIKSNYRLDVALLMKFQVERGVKNNFPDHLNNTETVQQELEEHTPNDVDVVFCNSIMHEALIETDTPYTVAYSLSDDKFMDITVDS